MVAAVLLSRIHGLTMGQGCVAGRDEKGLAREIGHEQGPTEVRESSLEAHVAPDFDEAR